LVSEVIVVDDASTDGTADLVRAMAAAPANPGGDPQQVAAKLRVVLHDRAQGIGAAWRTGFHHAAGDIIITQHPSLQYDPADYPRLVEPIVNGKADAVYGSRFRADVRRITYFWHAMGSRLITFVGNMVADLNLTDLLTTARAFRADVLRDLSLRSSGYGMAAELIIKLARIRARIYEVPVGYYGHPYWERNRYRWRDVFGTLVTLLRYALNDDLASAHPDYRGLKRMERLVRYNGFLFEKIAPYLGQRVLEVGSGTGNMTPYLLGRELVVVSDNNPRYLALLRNTFERTPNVAVCSLALDSPDLCSLAEFRFDTIVVLNVLEHIADDVRTLVRLREILEPNGRVVVISPILMRLFSPMDRALGHFRRYERGELDAKLVQAGFTIERVSYYNIPGMIGWYLNFRILRRRTVPGFQSRLNDWLVPVLRFEERLRPRIGMSVLVVGRKLDRPVGVGGQ
jgi:glycosyltransferase involved in cell wall biosynthesis